MSEKDDRKTDLEQDDKRGSLYTSSRNFVESIYVAVVLAFLLRAFLVEAFVIPTGSMATTLYGVHCHVECPACSRGYAVSTSNGNYGRAHCPNCGYVVEDPESSEFSRPAGGDHVIVLKYLYRFMDPTPWDVVVFRNPQNNRENYIKRLIGIPGESIQIVSGDIFFRRRGEAQWRIRRKPEPVQKELWQPVYDSDLPPDRELLDLQGTAGSRWRPEETAEDAWTMAGSGDREDVAGRKLVFAGSDTPCVLRFVSRDGLFGVASGYNRGLQREKTCTDIRIGGVFRCAGDRNAVLEVVLRDYDRRYKMSLASSGRVALLSRDAGSGDWNERCSTCIDPLGAGDARMFAFEKADFRVRVLVGGRVILESREEEYGDIYAEACRRHAGETDIQESEAAAVSMRGCGGEFELLHVRLFRDVYYMRRTNTGEVLGSHPYDPLSEYYEREKERDDFPSDYGIFGDFPLWAVYPRHIELEKHPENPELDEFFCLGDNSYSSHDGRCWTAAAPTLRLYDEQGRPIYKPGTVPRYNLIGKAVWVYWPSGFRIPLLEEILGRVNLLPNVGEMRLIR